MPNTKKWTDIRNKNITPERQSRTDEHVQDTLAFLRDIEDALRSIAAKHGISDAIVAEFILAVQTADVRRRANKRLTDVERRRPGNID